MALSSVKKLLVLGEKKQCFCQAIGGILFCTRLTGILPIKATHGKNNPNCRFFISKGWMAYSIVFQILYLIYFCILYSYRFACDDALNTEWYVMTLGYFITDFNSLLTLFTSCLASKRFCKLFSKIAMARTGSVYEAKKFFMHFCLIMPILLVYFIILLLSYIHVAILRINITKLTPLLGCSSLDTTYAVLIRGISGLFPTVQVIIIYGLTHVMCKKFDNVAIMAQKILEENSMKPYVNDKEVCIVEGKNLKYRKSFENELGKLIDDHNYVFNCLEDVNSILGLQLLSTVCSCLYTTIYYLYRYAIASNNVLSINTTHEKFHCLFGFLYRLTKLIIFIFLGNKIHSHSLKPLNVLKNCKIINLGYQAQLQIQTIIIQWSGKEGFLSACNVVKLGPWLVAPIAGNVITYLLVALQFDKSNLMRNSTDIFKSTF